MHFLIISLCSIGYFFCCSVLFTYCVILPINTPVCVVEFSSHIILCYIVKLQTRAPLPRNTEILHWRRGETLIMATHGTVGEFNSTREDWVSYIERLDQYFVANGILEEGNKQRAILLSCCGAATYQLIRKLVAPNKPTDKAYAEIVDVVKAHHQPRPSTIVQRFHFHTRTQKPGESVGDFIAQLRKLSEYCEFGNTLQDMLRDRLVCGCKDQRLQCKLLAEPELTFDKAFKIAKAMEAAEKEAKDLQETPSTAVHQLGRATATKRNPRRTPNLAPPNPQKATECYRCGGKHKATDCKFRDAECNFCKKKGHIAKVCRSKLKSMPNAQMRTHQLQTMTAPDADKSHEYSLFYTQGKNTSAPILVTLKIDGVSLEMELDTGATLSVISEQTYHKLFSTGKGPTLRNITTQLTTYTGEAIEILGQQSNTKLRRKSLPSLWSLERDLVY